MPVGTVLRDPATGDIAYRNGTLTHPWLWLGADGKSLRTRNLPPGWVELVEKPAEARTAPRTLYIDRDGDAWEQQANGFHMASCDADCPEVGMSRDDVENLYGPLTEETA